MEWGFLPVIQYIKQKRKNSRDYAMGILQFVSERQNETEHGVRRAKVINALAPKKSPFKTSVDRELQNLIRAGILERKEMLEPSPRKYRAGKLRKNVYLKVNPRAVIPNILISQEIASLRNENFELSTKLFFAERVLKRHHLIPEFEKELEENSYKPQLTFIPYSIDLSP